MKELVPELKFVDVNEESIDALAEELAPEDFPLPEWRAPVFPNTETEGTNPAEVIDFLFLGNSINFQFRDYKTGEKFTSSYQGTEWAGAFGMWASLKQEYDNNPAILRGDTLAELSISDVERIFESSNGIHIPMLEERHEILTQVGERLVDQYDGRFSNLVKKASPRLYADGDGIVDRLVSDFPSFQDANVVTLDDGRPLELPFWKRAQLAAGMAYGRFNGREAFEITDPDAFNIFVDYNLPNVLRGLGVLEYREPLSDLVNSRAIIEEGSREEVEIRAATVYAADELMKKLIPQRDEPVYGPHLDYKLFMMRDEVDTPIHLTRTTAY
ncbi:MULTISPECIES: queuosine salvage family protein [unclassified Haloferax]|uniref:queuosine salvage family protein n=1 Tax=unclassified Haloferax TaxID=2625095 RepID=UPI00287658B5|nr:MULTISPECIES: queuosine salvage family protein [unclassified Haloferax]MDS0243724.1 queuosine salvage family protein [Haloferax sp. S2CR25]MDS0446845.1 queuosine salvage family protein [Haloferax sp. S2CR25-2]